MSLRRIQPAPPRYGRAGRHRVRYQRGVRAGDLHLCLYARGSAVQYGAGERDRAAAAKLAPRRGTEPRPELAYIKIYPDKARLARRSGAAGRGQPPATRILRRGGASLPCRAFHARPAPRRGAGGNACGRGGRGQSLSARPPGARWDDPVPDRAQPVHRAGDGVARLVARQSRDAPAQSARQRRRRWRQPKRSPSCGPRIILRTRSECWRAGWLRPSNASAASSIASAVSPAMPATNCAPRWRSFAALPK